MNENDAGLDCGFQTLKTWLDLRGSPFSRTPSPDLIPSSFYYYLSKKDTRNLKVAEEGGWVERVAVLPPLFGRHRSPWFIILLLHISEAEERSSLPTTLRKWNIENVFTFSLLSRGFIWAQLEAQEKDGLNEFDFPSRVFLSLSKALCHFACCSSCM